MGIQTRLGGPCPGGAKGLQHQRGCRSSQQVGAEGRGACGRHPRWRPRRSEKDKEASQMGSGQSSFPREGELSLEVLQVKSRFPGG